MESKVTITAQLLALRDCLVVGDGHTTSSTRKWLWTGRYAKFDPLKGGASMVEDGTRKALTVKIPGAFVHPLDTEIEDMDHLPRGSDKESLYARHMRHVWAVAADDMAAVVSTMYNSLDSSTVLKLLPKHGKSKSFPYSDCKGEYLPHSVPQGLNPFPDAPAFIIDSPTQTLSEKNSNSEKILCHQCHLLIKPDDARNHVGCHILKSIKGVAEPRLHEQVCNI